MKQQTGGGCGGKLELEAVSRKLDDDLCVDIAAKGEGVTFCGVYST